MGFLPSCDYVSTVEELHHQDFDKMDGENSK